MVLNNLLIDARTARLADDYDSAMALCHAYLAANPGDPEAESLLGLCEIETNRPGGAKKIENAADRKPNSHTTLLNLSILRERQGEIRAAVQHASSAAMTAPSSFECWAQLGKLLGMAEKYEEALSALDSAHKLKPDHAGILMLLAAAALEIGEFDRCASAIAALEKRGLVQETVKIRAHLERKRGDWGALKECAEKWLKSEPSSEEARIALAHALGQQGYYDDAAAIYAPLCSGKAPAHHLAAMGRYCLGGRRFDDARVWFDRARSRDPACAEAAYGLARLHHIVGDPTAAEEWCRKTLRLDPRHADAFGLLADTRQGTAEDADIAAIDVALSAPRLKNSEKIALLFAKGDFLHAAKRPDQAYNAWHAANELKSKAASLSNDGYDPGAHEKFVSRLISLFPARIADQPPMQNASPTPTPIFIVGMPRSGTTLLETAIASHSLVDAAGEVPAMPFILDEFAAWAEGADWSGGAIDGDRLAGWRELYSRQRTRFGAAGSPFVTDKQPSNFLAVGLILTLFPEAKIIYLRRNPVETGFSIFRRNFSRQWPFSTNLQSIAHYYAEHCRISDHWRGMLGDRLFFVQYEDFVRNFESSLREIIAYCGLPWEDGCLKYYESARNVVTFSASQVRKPPSERHLDSTSPYAHRLSELKDSLAALGVDLETGERRLL